MSEIRIPFGPHHPSMKEPLNFTFEVDGEKVVSVKLRIGYAHRGIEKLAEGRTYVQNLYLVERVCGICSQAHTICYSQTVEELLGIEIPDRARFIRTILAELERLQSHYLWLGVTAHALGFDTLFMCLWRDREIVMNLLESFSGKRVNYGMNTIGGVRRDLTTVMVDHMRKGLDMLAERTRGHKRLCLTEPTILKRTVDIGKLSTRDALDLCAVGPTLRASGIKRDVRIDDPYAAYDEIDFNIVTYDGCDVASRLYVRCDEILESIEIIRFALDHLPDGDIRINVPRMAPEGEAVSLVEAPRGEDLHYVKGNGSDRPARLKIRAPTLANLLPLCTMLTDVNIADIPAVIAGVDLCIACAERLAFIDGGQRKQWIWTKDEMERYSARWYQKK